MKPGGANNPLGLGGKSGKTAEEAGIVNPRNTRNDKDDKPHHDDVSGVLRRLTRAAKGQKSHGVPAWLMRRAQWTLETSSPFASAATSAAGRPSVSATASAA